MKERVENSQVTMGKIVSSKRPRIYRSTTEEFSTGCGDIYVHISFDENDNPVELFASMGKAGGCSSAMLEAVGKSTSIGLRCGISPEQFIKQYIGIRCPNPTWADGEQILSCIDAMGRGLENAQKSKDAAEVDKGKGGTVASST
ncbi:MAG: TSCPD domain-containing protein [Deltaproteobacteria bacterium]|nr:TSCPD domain-containing protein [Deltaproteobacteria bacterium]